MTSASGDQAKASLRRHLHLGTTIIAALVFGIGAWAALADISGAVIALGRVVVESDVKTVQHPTGGVIAELRVRNGDLVNAGALVVRLDDTVARANLAIAQKALDELTARRARLEAERDDKPKITFPEALLERAQDPDVTSRIESEERAFAIGRVAREGQKAQLKERIVQLTQSIAGYQVRERAKAKETEYIDRELTGARDLWTKGLLPISKLTALEREATRLEGERGQFMSIISEAKARIAETELQVLQIDHDLRKDIGRELRAIDSKIGELVERKIAAEEQLKRIDVRAPQKGRVHQLAVHTIGGVITAGQPIMLIVPDDDELSVDVRVAPNDIDQLHLGQAAKLRLLAFNQRSTPELFGIVSRVAADIETDSRSGTSYYLVRIAVAPEERARLGQAKLVPGMPAEAFIMSRPRKVMSYLLKPLTDQMQHVFKED
ncbi:MAG: HlyD family type I secretion periplasmic adaptor subunit [Hyphomicrobiaceae bacterium]